MKRMVLGLALLVPAALLGAQEERSDKPKRPPGPGAYGFLLRGAILQKLDLSREQKEKLFETLKEFVGKNRSALDELRRDHAKARAAAQKARDERDREAFDKARRQMTAVEKRADKFRGDLEAKVLLVLTARQKKQYAELKKRPFRLGGPPVVDKAALAKLKPLTELGTGKYKDFVGGLYPDGKNERPPAHEKAGLARAKKVQPLGRDGKLAADGKIVLLSIGMSNTTQEFSAFMRLARADDDKNPQVVLVDGAQGGMTAQAIQDPESGPGKRFWTTVDRRLEDAGVTRAQVQAVWIKEADAGPSEGFPRYARKLEGELARIVQLLPGRFPNVQLCYLSSRTYAGYARTRLNPEPYAYESGFSVKWLIERQIAGEAELNHDASKGKVRAPWLSWGPYLWANGTTRRADGFSYEESDFGSDGTHPSESGRRKVAELLLRFFKSDSTTRPWFVKGSS
jgi:Spy/CpxP family protein refolding chaperone